jgi:hypothetical protein
VGAVGFDHARAQTVNVWAYRIGHFTANNGEWHYSVNFDTLRDLLDKLERAKLAKGQVGKLAIVAHGDSGGLVQLAEGDLTPSTAGNYAKEFQGLRDYLWRSARVMFCSCVSGRGRQGSALLNALSGTHFPGRHVIGFERYGFLSAMGQAPGRLWCATSNLQFGDAARVAYCEPTATLKAVTDQKTKREQILSEYSIYAKWSYEGRIIKIPHDEVDRKIETPGKVRYGPKAVEQAVKDPKQRIEIDYIGVETKTPSREVARLFDEVQREPFNFRWGPPQWRLRALPRAELNSLAGTPRHEGIVAVYRKLVTHEYKCAWDRCLGHKNIKDYCEVAMKDIPNGPGV